MSNVFVVRPIQAGLGFTSTDNLLAAIAEVSSSLKGRTGLELLCTMPQRQGSESGYVTEVFKLRSDGKFVDDVSFIFLMGKAAASIREHRDALVALAYSPNDLTEHSDPVSLQVIWALQKAMTKYRTPCTKSECSENCVMLEIRNAMDESI